MPDPSPTRKGLDKRLSWLLLLAILLLVAFIRIRLAPMPLERDEGEYALAGQFILRGQVPSIWVYTMKLPGVPLAYAGLMAILGQTATGIHLGLLMVNLLSTGLVLLIARTWLDHPAACFSAAAFAVLSLSPSLLSLAAHATHFVVLFVLGGSWLQLRKRATPGWWTVLLSGLLFGLAFLMKQTAAAFVVFGAILLLVREDRETPAHFRRMNLKLIGFILGVGLPYGAVCAWVSAGGGFHKFWFWTVLYAREYASRFTPVDGFHILQATLMPMVGSALALWVLGGVGLAALPWTPLPRNVRPLLLGLFLLSFLAVCPGYYFRQHYFIVLLPALALAGGVAIERLCQEAGPWDAQASKTWLAGLPLLALGYPFWADRQIFFQDTPTMVCRRIYGANPFLESPAVAKYLADHTGPDAPIAVLGSEPQLCFLAQRKPATGYIYTYGLMEPQPFARQMQREMIKEIEASHPPYLVFAKIQTSWLPQAESDPSIFTWLQTYAQDQFDLVGLVDIYSAEKTEYRWDQDVKGYQPKSPNLVLVYRRKPTPVQVETCTVRSADRAGLPS